MASNPELVEIIENMVNRNERDFEDSLVEFFEQAHPTLAQAMMRSIKQAVGRIADYEYADRRNEASVEWARLVTYGNGQPTQGRQPQHVAIPVV